MPKSDGKGNCRSDEGLDGEAAGEFMIHENTCDIGVHVSLSTPFEELMLNAEVASKINLLGWTGVKFAVARL